MLLDGPALRVKVSGRADGRYPLSRIARIVSCGSVYWRPYALLACLHFGIAIAQLDNTGRFVRLRFPRPGRAYGLARHLGDLLRVSRYRRRYEEWRWAETQLQMGTLAVQYGLPHHKTNPHRFWQRIVALQSARSGLRLGPSYRYLCGLTMAHVATLLSHVGLPVEQDLWSVEEWGFFNDMVQLERWHHPQLVARLINQGAHALNRRGLTHVFEDQAEAREGRIAGWRQCLLLEMMGIRIHGEQMTLDRWLIPKSAPSSPETAALAKRREMPDDCMFHNIVNPRRTPKRSLRNRIKIAEAWVDYNRGMHERL